MNYNAFLGAENDTPQKIQIDESKPSDSQIQALKHVGSILKNAKRIVAFTGAGISVESGIPDFRSAGGLWEKFDPEIYAHYETFIDEPEMFWEMSSEMEKIMVGAAPNAAHKALVDLQNLGKLQTIITQNVDNLHTVAGNNRVFELHGNAATASCIFCKKSHPTDEIKQTVRQKQVPRCKHCGNLVKTDVILFGEKLPGNVMEEALAESKKCDVMIVVGSSLQVQPANLLPMLAKSNNAKVIFVNKTPSRMDHVADFIFYGNAGFVLPQLVNLMKQ